MPFYYNKPSKPTNIPIQDTAVNTQMSHGPRTQDPGLSLIVDAVDNLKRQQEAEELANRQLQEKLKAAHDAKLAELQRQQAELQSRLDNLEPSAPVSQVPPSQIMTIIQKNDQKIADLKKQAKKNKQNQKFANLSAGRPASSK